MKLLFLLLFSSVVHAKQFDLVDVAFDKKRDDSQRWRSLIALSVQEGDQSIQHLSSAVLSNEWFMRDAALLAMGAVDTNLALEWARKLVISDPSMLVRATAVKIIKQNGSKSDIPVLSRAMSNKRNFRHGRSLWIRRHMAEAISSLDRSSYTEMLRLLDDEDARVTQVALRALEDITGHKPDFKDQDLEEKISTWKDILNND